MLRRMSRRVDRAGTEATIQALRDGIPGLTLRTTFITGFPGESDADFEELCEFVREQRFERMGVFTYSFEPDTPSARLPDHVEPAVMERRRNELMQLQQEIMFERNRNLIGTTIECIIDRQVPDHPAAWIGRSQADAPDVDALVFVTPQGLKLKPGDILPVEVVASQGYDLVAVAGA
jgi:ribosomal protein S12 methylthiotransferase